MIGHGDSLISEGNSLGDSPRLGEEGEPFTLWIGRLPISSYSC